MQQLTSVIIPSFNSNKKLARLLATIPKNGFEVIVVDDNGEEPAALLEPLFPHVHFYLNERKRGAGGARNTGLLYATGTHLTFADSDDLFITNNLKNIAIENDADITYFPPDSFLEDATHHQGNRHIKFKQLVDHFESDSQSIRFHFYPPYSKIYRADLIINNDIFFDETLHANDICFSLKAGILAKNIIAQKTTFYKIEQGTTSLTQELTRISVAQRLEAIERFNVILENSGYKEHQISSYFYISKAFTISPSLAFKHLIKTIKNNHPLFIDKKTINSIKNLISSTLNKH
ncbi:glycosyltransferase family 2 protein [Aestuariirhabdus litorea]|uniref:Glycosyltransferase family 2 protein n=1 Tax=Aestuariirhabdus litorea TaxID=2528527 RepID=A0A3P3VN90_9GAMM|nr:glycosyltransferase family 2 protein [Aestuariirhabdus litorea]RRJ83894.1 glycosyltransferase family 2 protein [Aestuariirhabdus litorea]RWW97116.1 glycosyltransferase [Endozoicomonadaceae bacterium GTF-13]